MGVSRPESPREPTECARCKRVTLNCRLHFSGTPPTQVELVCARCRRALGAEVQLDAPASHLDDESEEPGSHPAGTPADEDAALALPYVWPLPEVGP